MRAGATALNGHRCVSEIISALKYRPHSLLEAFSTLILSLCAHSLFLSSFVYPCSAHSTVRIIPVMFYCSLYYVRKHMCRFNGRACVCVIRPARTTSWLIVPRSAPLVMRVTQYQTKEMASQGDSSPLVEPVTAPSLHGRPLTDAHPAFPPSLHSPHCRLFSPTCMQAKTQAYSSTPSSVRRRSEPPSARDKQPDPASEQHRGRGDRIWP